MCAWHVCMARVQGTFAAGCASSSHVDQTVDGRAAYPGRRRPSGRWWIRWPTHRHTCKSKPTTRTLSGERRLRLRQKQASGVHRERAPASTATIAFEDPEGPPCIAIADGPASVVRGSKRVSTIGARMDQGIGNCKRTKGLGVNCVATGHRPSSCWTALCSLPTLWVHKRSDATVLDCM